MQAADCEDAGTTGEALDAFRRGEVSRWEVLSVFCRQAAMALGTARAGVWMLGPVPGRLTCLHLHDRRNGRSASGAVLADDETGPLLQALWRDLAIVVPDAGMHPATRDIYDRVLWPHGIQALLGAAIATEGRPLGLLLCEQDMTPRRWEADDLATLRAMAEALVPVLRDPG